VSDPNDIVGHKTFRDGESFRHEPLTRAEGDAIMARIEEAKAKRAELYPDAEAAVRGMWDAWYRLKELGWQDPRYAAADSRMKKVIEIGSTGIHDAHCTPRTDGKGDKWWWIPEGGYSPTDPLLYLPDEQEKAEAEERGARMRERFARRHEEVDAQNTSKETPHA
jgi:hypothetical protein